ncbi:hypothetical protein OFH34_005139 [Escherichia coli]|nr:hypothetical protein [Escherichia coli]EKD1101716.1 hypothetical protein [Escherichia coli]
MQLSSKYIISIASSAQILLPLSRDPKKVSSGSSSPSAQRYIPSAQHVVPHTVAHGTICCVISLTCDASRRGGKQRYDDFLSVVHFRKVVIFRKVGSDGNGSPVIKRRGYMDACYHGDDDNGMMLSDGVTVRAVMMDDVIA